jgi:hypothetical protein
MNADDARELKDRERENAVLKRLLADVGSGDAEPHSRRPRAVCIRQSREIGARIRPKPRSEIHRPLHVARELRCGRIDLALVLLAHSACHQALQRKPDLLA